MAKMSGLGKGLDALFGPAPEEEQMQENDILKNLKVTEARSFRGISRIYKRIWINTTNCCNKKRWILWNRCRRKKMESI